MDQAGQAESQETAEKARRLKQTAFRTKNVRMKTRLGR